MVIERWILHRNFFQTMQITIRLFKRGCRKNLNIAARELLIPSYTAVHISYNCELDVKNAAQIFAFASSDGLN